MNTGRSTCKSNGVKNDSENDTSTLCTQDQLALSSWGLPDKVLQYYAGKGITHMFKWQLDCLTVGQVLEGGNLVYSAPTSAGKTLVAEILIAQTIFERQKKVILILPFVSVVREKMFYFQSLFSPSGIKVEGFMGGHSPSAAFQHVHMGVCTIEKGNSVVNKLLEEQNLKCLGLVVIDELHLLGDPYRGYLLELLLTKLKYMSKKLETHIQIVGMSATLPNLKVLAGWLNADLYYSGFRPIPLSESLKCGNSVYDKKLNKIREIIPLQSDIADSSDHLGQLCLETIKNDHSVLIFCPSKTWCENLAVEISVFFKRHGCSKSATVENSPGWIVRNQINLQKIGEVIEHLKMTPVGVDEDLRRTIAYGVAFHHAGLTLDERDIIEGSFRNGSIRVLCATSTLSSGVNLPARRVIIRSPMAFGKVMDALMYRQMIGRAGRMGVDSEGESILICKANEKIICQKLMSTNLKPIESCLGRGLLSSSLKRALLEIVASGIASTPAEVKEYIDCTFLASSAKVNVENPISSCIKFLEENEFIRLQENGTIYVPTPLGHACLASSMPPDEGLSLFRELQRARRCFVLDTDLHIIYQVTPYSVSEQWTKLDWLHVLHIFENLPENMKRIGDLVGVEESFLVRIAKGTLNPNAFENKIKLSIHRRFYTALALQDLVNEMPLTEVAQKFECNKGTLQSLQQSAATYAGMVTEFTKKLGWESVELIFSQFKERLQFGVHRDLCELMRLPLLNVVRARALYKAGYTNLATVANASASDLELTLYSAVPFQSKNDIAGETTLERVQRNKMQTLWITGKADISVREAAETLIEQARDALELEMGVIAVQWGNSSERPRSKVGPHDSDHLKTVSQSEGSHKISRSSRSMTVLSSDGSRAREAVHVENPNDTSEGSEREFLVPNNFPTSEFTESVNSFPQVSQLRKEICRERSGVEENIPESFDPSLSDSTKFISTPVQNGERTFPFPLSRENMLNGNNSSGNSNGARAKCDDGSVSAPVGACRTGGTDYFTTSINADCFANILEVARDNEEFGPDGAEKRREGKIDESDCSSTSSKCSIEILCERSAVSNANKPYRLSGDLFDTQETESERKDCETTADVPADVETEAVDAHADLFSQSLTFDTQLQRMLDIDDHDLNVCRKGTGEKKLSSSLNSDDLGFFSDFSPTKSNGAATVGVRAKQTHDQDCGTSRGITAGKGAAIGAMSVCGLREENSSNKSHGRALKRKNCVSDSPDFIVGSDESLIEDGRSSKKAKMKWSNASKFNLPLASVKFSVGDDGDTEITSTPRVSKTLSLNLRPRSEVRPQKSLLATGTASGSSMSTDAVRQVFGSNKLDVNSINVKKLAKSSKTTQVKRSIFGSGSSANIYWDKINIVDVSANRDALKSFREELKLGNVAGLALGCEKVASDGTSRRSIGVKIVKKKLEKPKKAAEKFVHDDMILDGISVYFNGNTVYYVSFDAEDLTNKDVAALINEISPSKCRVMRVFDAKEQVKVLHNFTSTLLEGRYEDPKTAHWLLSKSWKEKSYSSIAAEYLPKACRLISQLGPLTGFSGPGLHIRSSVNAKTRACIEAFLSFHMMEKQLKFLRAKSLTKLFRDVEMPLVLCLAEMELAGVRLDRDKLMDTKCRMESEQSKLSEKASSFVNYKFSLASPAAVSKVLYNDLKLRTAVDVMRKKGRLSTSKEALQSLSVETSHPLPDIIIDWRKMQSIQTKVLSRLLELEHRSLRLYSSSHLYTATGRLTMHEPNLQNIPRNFSVSYGNCETDISVRDIFIPSEGCVLLSADYCQIELRLLAHFSNDTKLIENINHSTDIFAAIASHIFGVTASAIDDELRQKAKKTCYGIVYGIGLRALSHELRMEQSVASTLIEDFKMKYKGVAEYLENSLQECRKKGYVTSLMGRRRYLPHINDSNAAIRGEAERQAINTKIQGSAADILKIAMIKIREKFKNLKDDNFTFNLLLHLHDELLFEIDQDFTETVAVCLKDIMESVAVLKVPTPVKFHVGPSWGRLQPYHL